MGPLIVDVIIQPNQVDEIFLPAQLRRLATENHVARFVLAEVMKAHLGRQFRALRLDIDQRIDVAEPDARIHFAQGTDRRHARPHQLPLHFISPAVGEGVEESRFTSGEGEEGDLIYRTNERRLCVFAQKLSRAAGERGETPDEFSTENVESIRPSVMPEIPDHFGPGFARGAQDHLYAAEIGAAWARLDQVPA
jgi:hypothetical protein